MERLGDINIIVIVADMLVNHSAEVLMVLKRIREIRNGWQEEIHGLGEVTIVPSLEDFIACQGIICFVNIKG